MRWHRHAASAVLVVALLAASRGTPADEPTDGALRREQLQRSRAALSEAIASMESGALGEAAAALEGLLTEDPNNPDAHFYLGQTLLAEGDTLKATSILQQGVERAPMSTRIKLLLARLQIAAGRTGEAEDLLDRVLTIRPRDEETLYLKGLALLAAGDSSAALEAWRKSLEVTVEGK